MSMKRPSVKAPAGGVLLLPADGWGASYSAVWEFLALPQWEDGSPRVAGSITLFVEEGVWKACCNDKDGGLVAFVSGGCPEDLMGSLQAGLEDGTLDWRRARSVAPAKARKGG